VISVTQQFSIVIPVYNGRDSLLLLLDQIKKVTNHPIIVIDDGSTDGLNEGQFTDIEYLKHETNLGKGAALETGLEQARKLGFSHALTLDADGQHDARLIDAFSAVSRKYPKALIVGERDLKNNGMPFHRKLSNIITSLMLSLRTGIRVRDSQVGYRCYPLIDRRLWMTDEGGFQFESAIFFNVVKLRMALIWQPIPVIYGNEASHMHLVKDTLRFVRAFFRSFKC